MGYRVKYLVFLSVFLLGAFSIMTWKSFRVYSESYTQASLSKEMEVLEQRVQSIVSEFERFKSMIKTDNTIEQQLKLFQVPLMAHVIFVDGKWRAKWFEGVSGMRDQAKSLAHQISFESIPQSRNSWFAVNFQDKSTGYAFVMPAMVDSSVHFYTFFLTDRSIAHVLRQSSIVESFHVISPTMGEIYSSQKGDLKQIESKLSSVVKKNHGLLVLDAERERVALYQFHPFLQTYVFTVIPQVKIAAIPLSRFYGLIALSILLCGIAIYAMHLLLDALFKRIDNAVAAIEQATGRSLFKDPSDELAQLENLAMSLESVGIETKSPVVPSAQEPSSSAIDSGAGALDAERSEARSKVINSLGHLNRLKVQFQIDSPHMKLLEEELRDLRKSLDEPVQLTDKEGSSLQPTFDPILTSYQKKNASPKTILSNVGELTPVADETTHRADKENAPTVRRPKREIHDFGDL